MADTTLLILLVVFLLASSIAIAYQEHKIKKLEIENAILKEKLKSI